MARASKLCHNGSVKRDNLELTMHADVRDPFNVRTFGGGRDFVTFNSTPHRYVPLWRKNTLQNSMKTLHFTPHGVLCILEKKTECAGEQDVCGIKRTGLYPPIIIWLCC